MQISVKYEYSLTVLEARYDWKFPRLSWKHPDQELLSVGLAYHSRYDEQHYRQCEDCADDNADFMNEMALDAMHDAAI